MAGADSAEQYHLAIDASKWFLGRVLFQLVDASPEIDATYSYKKNLHIIMFMSLW